MFKMFKKKEKSIYAVATGQLIELANVSDAMFSQKMMGDGFAVLPTDGNVSSPIDGKVMSVFPTKHAITLETNDGLECLIHMGVDTVELNGEPFTIHVQEGDNVSSETLLATIDLDKLKSASKHIDIIVVFPNYAEKIKLMEMDTLKQVVSTNQIGKLILK
ncbi:MULTISPECIES: PTS glucose transporter subunit IIA [unclassified Vagococcus]|uniref:PTS sugar transporter subunit IIA n=1 Tax=unclassified Vagococcus TaxID=2648499 RepID=UPI001F507FFC|nr:MULTISPECIES: PTS glucose transporter subunit IIA [unclassified Vagococcus]MCI0130600.1 PTS glucose transporter subunit IIA [Vagococcus sp. CY53-2]UNM90027.1 PTS glucose transporter subunit IIA [Vagococcus sp. CY52-2]